MADAAGERVLVTGADGFVGRRLTEALSLRPGWTVIPAAGPDAARDALEITREADVDALVSRARPTVAVHLAAVSAVTAATRDPRRAWDINLGGTLKLTAALQRHAPACRLLFVSSGEVYGRGVDAGPATERTPLEPVNAYAASKAAADIHVRQLAAEGLHTTVVRPFNHTGPGQSAAFAVPAFAAQIASAERSGAPAVMRVGDLSHERDFLDVDDVVDAYVMLVESGAARPAGEVFNVASGRAVRMRTVLDGLLARSAAKMAVEADPERMRAGAPRSVTGDAGALRRLGWRPRRALEDTLAAVLDHERAALIEAARPPS